MSERERESVCVCMMERVCVCVRECVCVEGIGRGGGESGGKGYSIRLYMHFPSLHVSTHALSMCEVRRIFIYTLS